MWERIGGSLANSPPGHHTPIPGHTRKKKKERSKHAHIIYDTIHHRRKTNNRPPASK